MVLAMLRDCGFEPRVVEYLKTPPSREELSRLITLMGVPVRSVLRLPPNAFPDLGLDNPALTDDQLLDAMVAHPILINRPIVVTPMGCSIELLSYDHLHKRQYQRSHHHQCSGHNPNGLHRMLFNIEEPDSEAFDWGEQIEGNDGQKDQDCPN
jgi:arsenate reductase (glutaredoxin)